MANGPARDEKVHDVGGILMDAKLLIYEAFIKPTFNQINRSDLLWDNFDNLIDYTRFSNERNNWLTENLNSDSHYDNKIVAYWGSIHPSVIANPLTPYDNGSAILGGVFGFASDGIVPEKSARFDGHLSVAQTRMFPDYNHSELVEGKGNNDALLFGSISYDLLSNPAPTITAINPPTLNRGQTGDIILTGTNFFSGVTTVDFNRADISINSTTVLSSSQLKANITLSPTASMSTGSVTVRNATPGGGEATLFLSFSVLPVELSVFNAAAVANNVNLEWRTQTEIHNSGFEIERRTVGAPSSPWNNIGFVQGNGTSNAPHEYSFTDQNLSPGCYAYRLKQIDNDGSYKYFGNAEVEVLAPSRFAVDQNYPNPFNPSTTLQYSLPINSHVRLQIYDVLGQVVADLADGDQTAGWYRIRWNADVPTGIYFYRIDAVSVTDPNDRFVQVKKMQLLK
jgi:hypothetical protein